MTIRQGTVYLIGGGPGDPGLITVRGLEILRRVDCVLHDRLINPSLLDECRADAELIDVGKTPNRPSMSQERITEALVSHAAAGRSVARLKGGDPFVFGRGSEERSGVLEAGLACEVVPGVTSAIAGPELVGIPVTERGTARGFAVVTGQTESGEPADLTRYAHAETLVVLMGVRVLDRIVSSLIDLGRDEQTPVAIIERAGQPGERMIDGTLSTIVERAASADVSSPAVIIVGDVARGESDRSRLPLANRRIVVTRPRDAAHELLSGLRRLGAQVSWVPLIRIEPRPVVPWTRKQLASFDVIVVTSRHGARGLPRLLAGVPRAEIERLGVRIAAVGPTTAGELLASGLPVHIVPSVYRASHLVEALTSALPDGSRRAAFVRGTLARDELPDGLTEAGFEVESFDVYETRLVRPDARGQRRLEQADTIVFAAPSAVEAFRAAGLEAQGQLAACIGPTTANAAADAGFETVTAEVHSDRGIIETLVERTQPCQR